MNLIAIAEKLKTPTVNGIFNCEDWKEPHEVCGKDCPWTGDSYGVDMGCLPAPIDFIEAAVLKNQIYSCHSDYSRPCTGIKNYFDKRGIDTSKMKLVENN